jgi:nitroreductase/dihydropteridine reductase
MNILESLNWRYAVREFNDRQIETTTINELIEAVRLTPSSYGLQPYKLIVVSDEKTKEQLLPYSMGQTKVRDCSHLFILATKTSLNDKFIDEYFEKLESKRELKPDSTQGFKSHVKQVILNKSKPEQVSWSEQQAYIALGNLLTVAAAKRIDACPMGGFEPEGYNQVLGLNALGLQATVICALGYRNNEDWSADAVKIRVSQNEFCVKV